MAVLYELPQNWIQYDFREIANQLVEAKAAVQVLVTTPYRRDWVDRLEQMQLKMEVVGTSRVEGADFTENELDAALNPTGTPETLWTRSQRQAQAAAKTYRWIAALPPDQPIDGELIREIHSHLVTGCDDDHCPPGRVRGPDENVTFGSPRHRGCEGGPECEWAFGRLGEAIEGEFRGHDPLVQAVALHYHLAAMLPFLDGNGRTARAVQALGLQPAGLRDRAFIAMSNYYYEEKPKYLEALAEVRARQHDLTPFLAFALRGIALQCQRQFTQIRQHMAKALFRDTMDDLFNRLESSRKRVIQERQIEILKLLVAEEKMDWRELAEKTRPLYANLGNAFKALVRDVGSLHQLGAISIAKTGEKRWELAVRLEWPSEITEAGFFEKIKKMPEGRTYSFLP